MTVKAIRHHSVLPGRGENDAHAQYLRLTETSVQTMQGSLTLPAAGSLKFDDDLYLTRSSLIARNYAFDIRTCILEMRDLSIKTGKCAIGEDYYGGDIYICAGPGADVDGNITLRSGCYGTIMFHAYQGDIKAYAELMELHAGSLFLDVDCVEVCGHIDADTLALSMSSTRLLELGLTASCVGLTCEPFVTFDGCLCSDGYACAPILNVGTFGDYTLCGGIHIMVNGNRRYLLFFCCDDE